MEWAKQQFVDAHPDMDIDIVRGNNYDKALTMTAGGTGPDVLDMSTNLAFSYFAADFLQDLSPYISADKDFNLDLFLPASLVGYRARGAIFGLPSSVY